MCSCAATRSEDRISQASAHYQLGISYLNYDNIQPAFVEFQKAYELDPNNKDVLDAIGLIYLLRLNDYPAAVDYFKKALKVDKNFSEASNNLGLAYEKEERFNEAIAAYKEALSNPVYNNAEKAYNNLGRAFYRVRKYNEAIDSFKQAVMRSPDFHLPYYGLALCYNAIERYGDAAIYIKKAIEKDPAYNGDIGKARKGLNEKELHVKGPEAKDVEDLLDIMNY